MESGSGWSAVPRGNATKPLVGCGVPDVMQPQPTDHDLVTDLNHPERPRPGPSYPTNIQRFRRGHMLESFEDVVATEEPMEIRIIHRRPGTGTTGDEITDKLSVTMRTPGFDFELAAGFLYAEGVVPSVDAIETIAYCTDDDIEQEYNIVNVTLRPFVTFDVERLTRHFSTTSSCGVCGKASLDAIHVRGCPVLPPGASVSSELVSTLPDRLRESQVLFAQTGGLHAAGIFTADGNPMVVREDVGRHNAVDKVIGDQLLQTELPASDRVLVLSGRTSFELIQKALVAGIPIVVAVGAPSSLAVELAQDFNVTLVGFTQSGSFNVYSGSERILL